MTAWSTDPATIASYYGVEPDAECPTVTIEFPSEVPLTQASS